MKTNKYTLPKIILFLICGMLIFWITSKILQKPRNEQWDASGMTRVYNDKYDFIFAGTSKVICNINVEELYLSYGISSVTVGEPSQPLYLTYYTLEEALKEQTPKAVLLDVSAIFYSEEKIKAEMKEDEYHYVHFSLDKMKNNKTKYNALMQAKKLDEDINMWNYFFPFYYNHSNWENISKSNFVRTNGKYVINGNLLLTNIDETWKDWTNVLNDVTEDKEELEEFNVEYLDKIVDLCKKNNVDIILIQGSANVGGKPWKRYNTVQELAKQYGLDYIDLNEYNSEIGIDWALDSSDMNHLNVVGSKKWTDFLGTFLSNKYEYTDCRNTNEPAEFKKNIEAYQNILEMVEEKRTLLQATNLYQYLDTLYNLNKKENVIFISLCGNATMSYTDYVQNMLYNIGFDLDIQEGDWWNYYGILDEGRIVSENTSKTEIGEEGLLDNQKSYSILSGDELLGTKASIMINVTEYGQCGQGINIVVYNKKYDEVLSSVYFNINENDNPATGRIKDGENQIEKEVNIWENE